MSGIGTTDRYTPPHQEPDRFGFALIAALLLEAAATIGFVHFANQAGPVANHQPRIMKIQMLAPPPKPKPLPPSKPSARRPPSAAATAFCTSFCAAPIRACGGLAG